MDTKPPQFDELLQYLGIAIAVYAYNEIGLLQGIIVAFFMYHAYTWIVGFRHSRKQFADISESPLSSKYPKSFKITQDAFVAARDALNFRNRKITETELLNAINNCLRLLQALQNAISDEKYKPEKQSWKSLKLFILEFSEPLPDWVYERDYLLDQILAYTVDGSFSYYDYKQIQKKKVRQKQGQRRGSKKRKRR